MTRMLASVTEPAEAEVALGGGADIIDINNPGQDAPDVIRATVTAIGGRRSNRAVTVSAVTGTLPMQPGPVVAAVRDIAACGVDYVRLGLYPGEDAAACIRGLAGLAAEVKLVAVFFADASPDLSLLPLLAQSGFAGAMIDTSRKQAGRLLDHLAISGLHAFVRQCHAAGLAAGLAGGLETPDIPRLLVLAPDLLGFRGALCAPGGRPAGLDPARVQAVRGLIPPEMPALETRAVDYRLLATRGYPPPAGEDGPVDRVFVDDFVLPVFIGAYARERATPQLVRFAVDAWVMRSGRATEDMRDVFSYDLITDGIRLLVDAGHISFVETLAERIAAVVLAHPRVARVVVRVEKLETGMGTVGVEIERTRAAARAVSWPVLPPLAGATP